LSKRKKKKSCEGKQKSVAASVEWYKGSLGVGVDEAG
jgi:hypothetical protein